MILDVSRLVWRTWRGQFPTGIDRACLAYLDHYGPHALAMLQRGGASFVLNSKASQALFAHLRDRPSAFKIKLVVLLLRVIIFRMTVHAQPGMLYLNVGHTGLNHAGHRRWVEKSGVKPIYYIHDLIPITHPQFAREGEPERHTKRMHTVLDYGVGIIANSEDSINQLRNFAGQSGRNTAPALCAPLGLEPFLKEVVPPVKIDGPYFVVIGTIEGRKNHGLLIESWRDIIRKHGPASPRLFIMGQRGWAAQEIFEQLDKDDELRAHVVELGRCDDAILSSYLANARALLFPSFVEGQGLPLIEALAAGTPVIASDLAVFRETAGEIPEYLNPKDREAWVAMILDYCREDSGKRSAQLTRMQKFLPPLWDQHFYNVDEWLKQFG